MFRVGSSSKLKSILPSNYGSSSSSCIDSKNGWHNASSTYILVSGFKSNMRSSKSKARDGIPGNKSSNGTLLLGGRDSMYFKANSFVMCFLAL